MKLARFTPGYGASLSVWLIILLAYPHIAQYQANDDQVLDEDELQRVEMSEARPLPFAGRSRDADMPRFEESPSKKSAQASQAGKPRIREAILVWRSRVRLPTMPQELLRRSCPPRPEKLEAMLVIPHHLATGRFGASALRATRFAVWSASSPVSSALLTEVHGGREGLLLFQLSRGLDAGSYRGAKEQERSGPKTASKARTCRSYSLRFGLYR